MPAQTFTGFIKVLTSYKSFRLKVSLEMLKPAQVGKPGGHGKVERELFFPPLLDQLKGLRLALYLIKNNNNFPLTQQLDLWSACALSFTEATKREKKIES